VKGWVKSADDAICVRMTNTYKEITKDSDISCYVNAVKPKTEKEKNVGIKKTVSVPYVRKDKAERIKAIYEARAKKKNIGENNMHNY